MKNLRISKDFVDLGAGFVQLRRFGRKLTRKLRRRSLSKIGPGQDRCNLQTFLGPWTFCEELQQMTTNRLVK